MGIGPGRFGWCPSGGTVDGNVAGEPWNLGMACLGQMPPALDKRKEIGDEASAHSLAPHPTDVSPRRMHELGPAQVRPQGGGDAQATIGLLVVLQHRYQGPAHGQARTIEGVE